MVEVVWTESALQDLNEFAEHIAMNFMRYAELTVAELFTSTCRLSGNYG